MNSARPLARSSGPPLCVATLRVATLRAPASRQPERAAFAAGGCRLWAAPVAQPRHQRCSPVAASAPAAAAATYFSPLAWTLGTAATIAAYLIYFAALAAFVPRGQPLKDMQDKQAHPAMFRILVVSIFAVLLPAVVMPFPAMAVSGAWKAGLIYFLPVMAQLAVNIAFEIHLARTGRKLAVYCSSVGNNMARMALAAAALVDMSLLGTPHPALWMVSCTQVACFAFVILLVVPAAISQLPVQAPIPTQPAAKASG